MPLGLKLKAESADDLTVISSVLQDAIIRIGEISYDRKGRSLTLRLTRFRHENGDGQERVLCGLRVDGILSVASRGIERDNKEALAVLLSVGFVPSENVTLAPSGKLHLVFAGNGEIVCDVEAIDLILADTAPPRRTKSVPLHPDD
ncbi:DUF2948 family protein [Fretibacter rubidus]|uniref:DUF2948 family protein n=1 Tax=Fretibacter rubidus TaxID=570162 RepID=UPI003529DD74